MRRSAIFLAMLALAPLATACGGPEPGNANATVTVRFAPPLGQPLYYRFQATSRAAGRDDRSQSLFVVTFSRAPDGLVMTVSSLLADGRRASETGLPAALADRRFRVGANGRLLGMENEAAHWVAIERLLAEHGPTDAEARESRAMLQSARDSRALPLDERMTHLAQNAWPITFYAGESFTREPREARASKVSIVGEIEGTERTLAREASADRVVIVESFLVAPERMQAAMDALAARYGRRPAGVGSRHISNTSEVVTVLDPRTGLVQRRHDRQEMVSEEAGRILRRTYTSLLERVGAPRPGATHRPGSPAAKAQSLR